MNFKKLCDWASVLLAVSSLFSIFFLLLITLIDSTNKSKQETTKNSKPFTPEDTVSSGSLFYFVVVVGLQVKGLIVRFVSMMTNHEKHV